MGVSSVVVLVLLALMVTRISIKVKSFVESFPTICEPVTRKSLNSLSQVTLERTVIINFSQFDVAYNKKPI